jgi:hypothetical protein
MTLKELPKRGLLAETEDTSVWPLDAKFSK